MNVTTDADSAQAIADIWFFNVGQGDCTLIVDHASRQAVLIDCPTWHVDELHATLALVDAEIFAAVVTHWDLDHYGGLSRISQATNPSHVYYNHDTLFPENKPQYGKYIKTTLQAFLDLTPFGTVLHSLRYEDEFHVGAVRVRFLAPTQEEVTRAYLASRRNVASAVVEIEAGSFRALIGGDAVAATWERLLVSSEDLSANIVRWPHHGATLSGGSNELIDRVLDAVGPEQVIISAGFGNNYMHPSRDVVSSAIGRIRILCTEVTAQCFGYRTRYSQETAAARSVLDSVLSPACAGTVRVTVTESGIIISPSVQDHTIKIDDWPQPMCRSQA